MRDPPEDGAAHPGKMDKLLESPPLGWRGAAHPVCKHPSGGLWVIVPSCLDGWPHPRPGWLGPNWTGHCGYNMSPPHVITKVHGPSELP